MVATGALGETNPFSTADKERMVPEMGAATLPLLSTFARDALSCSMVAL